jgi:hypothetical protein
VRRFRSDNSEIVRLLTLHLTAGRIDRYASIHWLNDDILLDIFDCYRLDKENGWNVRLGWRSLSHVCQRWRLLIYESTFHLGLQIQCANGTGLADALDHLPPLPLLVEYRAPITERDELGIYHALRLQDRVRQIYFHLPPSILHKCLGLMNNRFPMLEHLSLWFAPSDNASTLLLPKGFLAPNLRHLDLPGIAPARRLHFLTSTLSLTTLNLWNIQTSSYFRPRLLVARLLSLPQLEDLGICFYIPIPRPSAERELLGEQGAPVTLPSLKHLRFRGVSAYIESLVAQLMTPLLEQLNIVLFNQIAFALPHLSHFINMTQGFKLPAATVSFDHGWVSIITARDSSQWSDEPLRLLVRCKQLDWQIDCAAQVCTTLIPTLSGVEQLRLDSVNEEVMPKWKIDSTAWHELLRSFIGLKEVQIQDGLLQELSRVLEADEVGSEPGFLPNLEHIVAADNQFASFIETRRIAGRPIEFRQTAFVTQ